MMLVKDEADVIGFSLPWLLDQVDHVIVADNGSTDGTLAILHEISEATGRVDVIPDGEVAYNQDAKTTRLAQIALAAGHEWVVPCDADEFWRTPWPDVRLGDALASMTDDILFVTASLYDHKATGLDPDDADPRLRQGWRFVEPSKLPKVACRLHPTLRIGMGNHEASVEVSRPRVSSTGNPPTVPLLVIEHYSWRSADQFVRKIRNGALAYLASDLPDEYGAHWRAFGHPDDEGFEERCVGWFNEWAYVADPSADPSVGFFPFPFPSLVGFGR